MMIRGIGLFYYFSVKRLQYKLWGTKCCGALFSCSAHSERAQHHHQRVESVKKGVHNLTKYISTAQCINMIKRCLNWHGD